MSLSPAAQTFVNLARERDRAELRQPYVKFPGPLGVELGQPNQAARRALETEKLTDEAYAVRLGVSYLQCKRAGWPAFFLTAWARR